MKLSQPLKNQSIDRANPTDWIAFITDDRRKPVIPVSPRFQAEVPSWRPKSSSKTCPSNSDTKLGDTKWLGTPVWPLKGRPPDTRHDMAGKGRPQICKCELPGSIGCVRRHVYEKKLQLQMELGPAFLKWKFNVMGEEASQLWSEEEQRKFDYILKMELTSEAKGFVKSATRCFPCHSKQSIAHYYLNVYIPRRISVRTRLEGKNIDSDNDDSEEECNRRSGGGGEVLCVEGSRKRLHADFTTSSRKYIKTAPFEWVEA